MPWIDAVVGTQAVRFADCTIGGMARICTESRSTARKVIGSRTCSIRYESAFLCVSVWLTARVCMCWCVVFICGCGVDWEQTLANELFRTFFFLLYFLVHVRSPRFAHCVVYIHFAIILLELNCFRIPLRFLISLTEANTHTHSI